jgi:hypothetical protein
VFSISIKAQDQSLTSSPIQICESFPFKSDNLPDPIPFEPILNNFSAIFELMEICSWGIAHFSHLHSVMKVGGRDAKTIIFRSSYILMDK